MPYEIVTVAETKPSHRDLVANLLQAYNDEAGPPPNYFPIVLLVNDEEGNTKGGLWGRAAYDWVFIEYLVVPKDARGHGLGSRLIAMAEEIARERNCVGVWLDTFSFQALPFYRKLGYTQFGELEDNPRGGARFFLKKRFA